MPGRSLVRAVLFKNLVEKTHLGQLPCLGLDHSRASVSPISSNEMVFLPGLGMSDVSSMVIINEN
jgi:hypothetical protein